jgi:hypothetical protein
MPPYGIYSIANTPEELLSRGYGTTYNDIYDPAFGQLRSDNLYASAPFTGSIPFQNINRLTGYYDPVDIPSFGGISGYRNVGGIDTLPAIQKDFRDYSFQDFYNYNTRDEYDPEKNDYDQVQKIQGPEKKGIAKLMEVLGNIPTPLNLLRKAFEGVGPGFIGPKGSRAYGDESLFSTFGRSRTGAEFFQNMRDRKARDEAAKRGAIKQQELAKQTALQQMRSDDSYGGGGADRPGGFGSGAGSFRESDPTGTEGSF